MIGQIQEKMFVGEIISRVFMERTNNGNGASLEDRIRSLRKVSIGVWDILKM